MYRARKFQSENFGGIRIVRYTSLWSSKPMRSKLALIMLLTVDLLAASCPLLAHHGAASFENSKTVTIEGTVTEFIWTNPHVHLKVDAKDENGNIQNWVLEAQSVVNQANAGWTKTMFKPGDHVLIDATPAKGDRLVGIFKGRIVINGREFKRLEEAP